MICGRAARHWWKNAKGSVSANGVRRIRVSGTAERRPALNAGNVGVVRARIEHSARRRARLKDVPCANGYVGIASDVTSSAKCESSCVARHARVCFC